MSILAGIALGLIGACPLFVVLYQAVRAKKTHAQAPSIPQGFCAVVVSALIVMAGIYALYCYASDDFILSSTISVSVLLICAVSAGVAAWHAVSTAR